MRRYQGGGRPVDRFRRRIAMTAQVPGHNVLVAFRDGAARIEVTAGLVLAGYHVILARTPERTAALLGAVDIVVADGRLVTGLGRAAHEALRRAVFIAVCQQATPTPLAARARFTPPYDIDDLVTAVMMLERPRGTPRTSRAAASKL